jgi:hypothetical protein
MPPTLDPTTWAQINTAHIKAFDTNFKMAVQQKKSRVRGLVANATQSAQYKFWTKIEAIAEATELTTPARHAPTQYSEINLTRRRLGTVSWYFATLLDEDDEDEIISDPSSGYMEAIVSAFNRKADKNIINAFFADVATGEDGGSTETYAGAAGKPGDIAVGSGAAAALTIDKLRNMMIGFHENDYFPEENGPINALIKPKHLGQLLQQEKAINGDYITELQAISDGKLDKLMGFRLQLCNLLNTTANVTDVPVFAGAGMLFATAREYQTRADLLPGMTYNRQMYASYKNGAVRMDSKLVGRIKVDDTAVPNA